MTNDEQTIIETAVQWLNHSSAVVQPVFLVTVAKTWGSSPRSVGSIMAINYKGEYIGSVSGGCVEPDLVNNLIHTEHKNSFPVIYKYGINKEESQRFGLPCGGCLELVIEELETPAQLQPVLDKISQRQTITRHVCLTTGEVSFSNHLSSHDFKYDKHSMVKLFGPDWCLLIIGANHLSQFVAKFALTLDYKVIVCDPREQQAINWRVDQTELETGMPDDVVKRYSGDPRCAIITLAHEPNLDDMALMEALDSNAFYVGALGSKSTSDNRRKRLKTLGVSETGIINLHGPIGLPIGSHTPAEIAISIIAEITAVRNGKQLQLSTIKASQNIDQKKTVSQHGDIPPHLASVTQANQINEYN